MDNIVVAAAGWFFWIIVGKFSSTSDVGYSTFLITVASFTSGILLLGLEFSLLKKVRSIEIDPLVSSETWLQSSTFGIILIFEVLINVLSIPFLILFLNTSSTDTSINFVVILLLLTTSIGNLSRYALIGIMKTKLVFLVDTVSVFVRLGVALVLIGNQNGSYAILLATLLQTTLLSIFFTIIFALKKGINFGNKNLFSSILREGISNFPGKMSKLMIAPLSVILLGVVGINDSDIGIFFICLIITIVAASFATSLAMVSLSSSTGGSSTSDTSLRLGVSLTIPLIVILVVFPKYVLGLINSDYIPGHYLLIILSLAILPSVVVLNVITRLNSNRDNRNLIIIGGVEVSAFLISFFILTPYLGTLGTSIAVLVSYLISATVACRWLTINELGQLSRSIILLFIGLILGILVTYLDTLVEIQIVINLVLIALCGYYLRVMTFSELRDIVSGITRHS